MTQDPTLLSAEERLAVVYDLDNPDGPDHDFFRSLVAETGATDVADIGCGTGILTVTLTGHGRRVVGIDPDPAMLGRARRRPGGDRVAWVLGDASALETASADVVIMSGNVAMHMIGTDWHESLAHVARALRPGGWLAFETRNPEAQAWLDWHQPLERRETPVGGLTESTTTDPPDQDGVVVMHCHNLFDDGLVLDVEQPLQFREHGQVVSDLADVGLTVDAVYRNWQREPFTGGAAQRLMVFVARRPA